MDFILSIVLQTHLLAIFWFNWLDPSWSFWQTEGYQRCTTGEIFPLQLACFALFLFANPPFSSVRPEPNPSNLNWVTLVPRWKLWGRTKVWWWSRGWLRSLGLQTPGRGSSSHSPLLPTCGTPQDICHLLRKTVFKNLNYCWFPLLFWVHNPQPFLQNITFFNTLYKY